MKELTLEYFANFWTLLNSIAFFILLGVLIAGVFKLLLPDSLIKRHLGQHNFMANIKAAVLGIPLPLRSSRVISFISALRKSGVSKSVTQTFLVATPMSGADSILATYGVFGWVFTIYRIITSVVIALIAGLLTLLFVKEESDVSTDSNKVDKINSVNLSYPVGKPLNIPVVKAEDKQNVFKQIFSYAFDTIFKDIARSLILGILIGALIVTFIPENLSEFISSNTFFSYVLVLLASMPLYVGATVSIPLGLALLAVGFSPGAVFVFLTAGPATNSMSVVLKTLGKMSLIIYLSSVLVGSLVFGLLFDSFFSESLDQIKLLALGEEDLGFIAQVSSLILLYLSLKYIFVKDAKVVDGGGCGGCSSGGAGGCAS